MCPNRVVAEGSPWISTFDEVAKKSEVLHREDGSRRMEDILNRLDFRWSPNLLGRYSGPLGPLAMQSTMKTVVT